MHGPFNTLAGLLNGLSTLAVGSVSALARAVVGMPPLVAPEESPALSPVPSAPPTGGTGARHYPGRHRTDKPRAGRTPLALATAPRLLPRPLDDVPALERGVRGRLLDSFLQSTHGKNAALAPLHLEALDKDPILYGHLARWYQVNGSVRDHHELFASHLLASAFPEHRDQGIVLMQYLRPYQVARVVRYSKEVLHRSTRALRTAVRVFLQRREAWPAWFDECVIRDRRSLKYLYATLHVRPDERSEAVLFQDRPPAEGRVAAVRRLASLAHDPAAQARLIMGQRIQFTTALGAVRQFTPAVLYALASVMTPQQVINHMKFFEARGVLQDVRFRALVEEKLRHGRRDSRVSDFKSMVALSQVNADESLARELLALTSDRIKQRGAIEVPTALLVDKSGSMQECIEIGKLLAVVCSTITTAPLYVNAFDTSSFEVKSEGTDLASWTRAFRGIRADGGTSIGAGLTRLAQRELRQIVVISDGEENSSPFFRSVLDDYEKAHGGTPVRVVLIKVGGHGETTFEQSMRGRDFTVTHFDGDYYNLPNLVPMLCSGAGQRLVQEVLDLPLYTRDDLERLPRMFDEATCEVS